eukprot:424303-Prymnesium_polylepis.2
MGISASEMTEGIAARCVISLEPLSVSSDSTCSSSKHLPPSMPSTANSTWTNTSKTYRVDRPDTQCSAG